jgi:UDP-N-acetyl-2-amino-2-deoxyglucuronate dehydrogenase
MASQPEQQAAQKAFALIGAAGFVAPRHMRAMKEISGILKAAMDPADSVGILDSYFPEARFFVEFERFDRHIDKLRRRGERIDYVSICSPNYLHDAHIRFALRSDADAICEKPLVLNPWNIDGLADIETSTGHRVNAILQLRLHPAIIALKGKISGNSSNRKHEVDLTYVTARGQWYSASWKGNEQKSGGIATNIGVHFYDMLSFVFGALERSVVHYREADCASGYLEYEKARARWFLSINRRDLPRNMPKDQTSFRSIVIDGEELEFSGGFTDLHTRSYQKILKGHGFGLDDVRPSIEVVSQIRTAKVESGREDQHPFLIKAWDKTRYFDGRAV